MDNPNNFLDVINIQDPIIRVAYDYLIEYGLLSIVSILGYSVFRSIAMSIFNVFSSKKIMAEIKRDYAVKSAIQKAENSRLTLGADRILTAQLHNGERFVTKRHLYKLSVIQEISIENPYGEIVTKSFDRQIKNIPISMLYPLLNNVTKKRFDIVSVQDLKSEKFIFYKQLKRDKIGYIILVSIMHKQQVLGYLMLLFGVGKIPYYDKEQFEKLVLLGDQIGEILS